MFPDFSKMQAEAAKAMERAEVRHVELMAAQNKIAANQVELGDLLGKILIELQAIGRNTARREGGE